MSKEALSLVVDDLSLFTRNLAKQLREARDLPGHLSLMNMVARSAGFRNHQHLRAAHAAARRLATVPEPEPVDHRLVERCLNQFDADGHLIRWPSRRAVQDLCVWALWADLPARKALHERDVNALLRARHLFEDPAILRRSLVTLRLVTRDPDGSNYRRVEALPPAEARALISHLERRRSDKARVGPAMGRGRISA